MPNIVYEGVLLPFALGLVLLKTIWAAVTAPIFNTSPTYLTHVGNAGVRALLRTLSPTQIQLIIPSFLTTYRSYAGNKFIEPKIVPIDNTTTSGFWLGNPRKATNFMLYIHGGGYVVSASPGHIAMLDKFISWSDDKLAIFCVSYTLSPEAVYPLAFSQCVEALRDVLSLTQIKPSNLILAGDSAGGALVLGLLSHISGRHPHPNTDVVRPLNLPEGDRIKAAILIDPFISNANTASMKKFATRDTFDKPTADSWLLTYNTGKPGYEKDPFILPAFADADWWSGTKCEQIFCTVGEEESLRDAILEWVDKYRKGMSSGENARAEKDEVIRLMVGEKETHIYPILSAYDEKTLEELGEKVQEGALKAYIKEIVAR